jgi:hypothetical protein
MERNFTHHDAQHCVQKQWRTQSHFCRPEAPLHRRRHEKLCNIWDQVRCGNRLCEIQCGVQHTFLHSINGVKCYRSHRTHMHTQDVLPDDPPRPAPADLTVYPTDDEMVADWTSGQRRALQLAWQLRMRPSPLMASVAASPPANLLSTHGWYAQPWVEEQEALAKMSAATTAETEDTVHVTAPAAAAAHASAQLQRCARVCDVRVCACVMRVCAPARV